MSRMSGAGIQAGSNLPAPIRGFAGANVLGELWTCEVSLLHKSTLTNPAAKSSTFYVNAAAGPNATTTAGTLANTTPDFTRVAEAVVTHATSVVAMTIVVTGIDMHGRAVSETLTVPATGTSQTVTGNVAFRIVSSIALTAAGNASANTVNVGTGNKFGLAFKTTVPSLVKEMSAGSVVTNGTLVAGSSSANADYRGTYSPNTTPNGSTTYILWYLVEDPTDGLK